MIQNAFDGIDIDYERVPTASRAQFTDFINVLAGKLQRVGKKLSVTVYPKISDKQNWDGPGSQDWKAIGVVADFVKIMVYDFHWSTSEAGSITPLSWLDGVATYAESVMAPQKVIIGLPFYGYDWVASKGTPVDYSSAQALIRSTGASVSRDAEGEVTFSYSGGHVVYFQDAQSYSKKVDVIVQKHPSIGGFAHWRAGNEDPAIWQRVAALKSGSATPALSTKGFVSSAAVRGDVNGDGLVTSSDIFYLTNHLFSGGPAPIGMADADSDRSVTTADIFFLINFLFAGGPAPI